jgi:ADP-ribose pyrophosphatase YjhB (NUDIX family)
VTDLVKAHIKGHMRGTSYVRPHERGGPDGHEPVHHPEVDHKGQPVVIKKPTEPSAPSTWHNSDAVATFVPGGDVPAAINGVPIRRWKDHPTTDEGWEYSDGINDDLVEPPIHPKPGKSIGAGVVIEEPDGRVWLCAPTNQFGGYHATIPKGTAEEGMSLQATALKETFEEAGLKIRITGFVGDFERSTSVARVYRAVRVGGDPTACGWESQGMHLAPKGHLYDLMNGWADHPIAEAIGAGPAPKKPAPTGGQQLKFGGLYGKK